MKWSVLILAGLLFFLAVGSHMEHSRRYGKLRKALRCPSVPTALLNRGSVGRVFRELRLVKPVRNDGSRFRPSREGDVGLYAGMFQKKRLIGGYVYEANPDWRKDVALNGSAIKAPVLPADAIKSGWAAIAVQLLPDDLIGEKWGIMPNWRGHGREWERPARIAYYEEGVSVFSSMAGIRLHGGRGRLPSNPRHSFRLYFRDDYGAEQFKPGVLFGPESEPLRHLIVHDDWPESSHFANILAFDIARQMGCSVPSVKPVIFCLNGELQGIYYLSEQINREHWASRLGHRNFLMHIHRGPIEQESVQNLGNLHQQLIDDPCKISLAWADKNFNLDSVSRWIFSIVYCGTSDAWQGAAVLDRNVPDPKWAWINWDMDHSFWDMYGDHTKREPWQTEGWERVLVPHDDPDYGKWRARADVRIVLFTRLINESPEYRARFVRLVMDLLNHRITEAYVNSRVDVYEKLATKYGLSDLKFISNYREYARNRPDFLRKGMKTAFGTGAFHICSIKGPPGAGFRVDGYPERSGYTGEYLEGESLEALPDEGGPEVFSHWVVNGERVEQKLLSLRVTAPLHVEAIYRR